jgi:hypothetical protein
LLLLDNYDHLVAFCADLAEAVLRHLLATSLQPLGATAETTWRVPPLAVPATPTNKIEELAASEAVRMFVARVQVRLQDFALDERNTHVVAGPKLQSSVAWSVRCRAGAVRLDPWASAKRSVRRAATSARPSPSTRAATSSSASGSPSSRRQMSLDGGERVLQRRLGVFVGGWTL